MAGALLFIALPLSASAQNVRVSQNPVQAAQFSPALGGVLSLGLPRLDAQLTPSFPQTQMALPAPVLPSVSVAPAAAVQAAAAPVAVSPVAVPRALSNPIPQRQTLVSPERQILNAYEKPLFQVEALRLANEQILKAREEGKLGQLHAIFDGLQSRGSASAVETEPAKQDSGLSGKALLQKLHDDTGEGLIARDYREAMDFLFSVADNVVVNGVRGVIGAYSGVFVPGTFSDGSRYRESHDQDGDGFVDRAGMNVEHLWPQSFFGRRPPMRSDMHHLMATFNHSNSERSNHPFGQVADRDAEYRTRAGAKLGRGVFEPPDAVKGRVARGMLYFYMRYYDSNILPNSIRNSFWNERVEMFLRWNRAHPPDEFERRRNDLVEEWQGNRNPFVDEPALVDRIGVEGFRMEGGRRQYAQDDATQTADGRGVQSQGRGPAMRPKHHGGPWKSQKHHKQRKHRRWR